MRFTLTALGRLLLDVRVCEDDDGQLTGPTLEAAGHLQDSTRAEPAQPDTPVFGFRPPTREP